MRPAARLTLALALAVTGLLASEAASAQARGGGGRGGGGRGGGGRGGEPAAAAAQPAPQTFANPAHAHLANVTDRFADTPSQRSLFATAAAELAVTVDHAGQAAEAGDNLGTMKLHAGHVINTIDPTLEANGPGLGYGAKKAAQQIVTEMEAAIAVPGASASMRILSNHILASTRNAIRISDLVVATAKRVQAATTAEEALEIAQLMAVMAGQIQTGFDMNNNNAIELSESGLRQAEQRAALLKRAEGIGAVVGTGTPP
jgi:hypothetical protein